MIKEDQLYNLFNELGQRPIAFHKIYAQITGSITAGLLLSQIVYWSKTKNHESEFYKRDKDFIEELGMSQYELGHAKKTLTTLEIIRITKRDIPAQSYYKLDISKLIDLITNFSLNTSSAETVELDKGKPLNLIKGNPSTNSETYTETNTETTDKRITQLSDPIDNFLSSFSEKKRDNILDVFDLWNAYKGEPHWRSHTKLTFDMVNAIQENLKYYSVEQICSAINNYATILIEEKYFFDYTWPLTVFLTVKEGKTKDSLKKWIKFFHPENFIEEKWLRNNLRKEDPPLKDPDPEMTAAIIEMYKKLIDTPEYSLTICRKNKFIETTEKMLKFFERGKNLTTGNYRIPRTTWVDYLKDCMIQEHKKKGDTVHPGHLCANNTWDTLMPQYLQGLGQWYEF